MAKFARPNNMHRLWVYGKCHEFFVVTSNGSGGNLIEGRSLTEPKIVGGVPSNFPEDFDGTLNNPTTSQKTQIVLHCTAGNSGAENTIGWWNNPASPVGSAHYVVERSSNNQAPRPAPQNATNKQDTGCVDAVLVMPENTITYHGGVVNDTSIGIEISNVGWGFQFTDTVNEPTLHIPHTPESSCPTRINLTPGAPNPVWRCSHRRPNDQNRYIHLQQPLAGYNDYQAYEDKQYATLILLLRHLCIAHRIPRTFLGKNTVDVFRHYCWSLSNFSNQSGQRKRDASAIFYFRGILHHRNVHENKPCPGIVHRNRLFRGITDEWWMPIEYTGAARDYYSGPFKMPVYQNNIATRPGFFRWGQITGGNAPTIEAHTYHDADLDAITSITSYYNPLHADMYYALSESEKGGIFPLGLNKIWHGGSHYYPLQVNPVVYAAASGTIVAARLSSNAETDSQPGFGSQRFVLIRHAVYTQTENDPAGVGTRINYSVDPAYIFSLYMHLAPYANLQNDDNANPPWFNLWLRNHPNANDRRLTGLTDDGDKGRVFNPDIEVNVGDVLGIAGQYSGQAHCVHFEVFSHRNGELTCAPWNNANLRFDDSNDADAICDLSAIDNYIKDMNNDGLDIHDIMRGARSLRNVKTLHKSEWSLQNADALKPAIPNEKKRNEQWTHIKRFTWWNEAIAANNQLNDQIGTDGIIWHYHPISFMKFVNQLVSGENKELTESMNVQTNVELDEKYYLVRFIGRVNNNYVSQPADAQTIIPYQVPDALNRLDYHFARRDLACVCCRTAGTMPTTTHFNLALLDAIERIRLYSDVPMTITSSHVCNTHSTIVAACCSTDASHRAQHNHGHAVDFHPTTRNAVNCRNLYNAVRNFIDTGFHPQANMRGGNIFQDCLPPEFNGMAVTVFPASAQTKLTATPQVALLPNECAAFVMHLALSESPSEAPAVGMGETRQYGSVVVKFISLKVIDDGDWFGDGEWELTGFIMDKKFGPFKSDVSSGTTIPFPADWTSTVTVGTSINVLDISVNGMDIDLIFNDDLGVARASFTAESTPSPWGIGQQVLKSSKGSFEATVEISA